MQFRSARFLLSVLTLGVGLPMVAVPMPAAAAPAPKTAPKAIGKFDDWTAATHQEGGQTVCYAFTRPQNSAPAVPGRGEVVLSVTERPTGRDAVALSAGFAYAQNADVTVQVDQASYAFYTGGRSAFAREGAKIITAFEKGSQAVARSPGPRSAQVVDTFSLKGFTAAYEAISKACPAR